MNILLDTHILIWALEDNERLSERARELIIDPKNMIYVSAASVWEIAIKTSIGKLSVPDNLLEEIESHQFTPLPVELRHADAVKVLPDLHKDPFDRLLIAQAKEEKLKLMTINDQIVNYPVETISL